jgi:hypothetical protein
MYRFFILFIYDLSDLFIFVLLVGHGLVVETNLGHVEVKNSLFDNNQGNGVKVKFLDGRYALFDDLLTFCKMVNLDRQTFPQTIIGIPTFSTSCARVRTLSFMLLAYPVLILLQVTLLILLF